MRDSTSNSRRFAEVPAVDSAPMAKVDSRYSIAACREEVVRVSGRIGRGSRKWVAGGLDLDETAISAKLRGVNDNLTVEQIGRIANFLNGPAGWPWVPWEESALLAALPHLKDAMKKGRPA